MPDSEKTRDQLILEVSRLRGKVEKLEKEIRLQTAGSVENSELRLLEMVENTSESIFVVQHGSVKFSNPACSEFTGYSSEEILNMEDIERVVHPSDLSIIKNHFSSQFSGLEYPPQIEFRIICSDLAEKWVEIHSSFMIWDDEPALLCFMRDISSRKMMEKQLLDKTHALSERVKEVSCLYHISKLTQNQSLSLEQILEGIVVLVPPAWQFPEITCCRINIDGHEFSSGDVTRCVAVQSEAVFIDGASVGQVEVGYLRDMPQSDEGPFLIEERRLVEAISQLVADVVIRKRSDEALKVRGLAMDTSINGIRMIDGNGKVFYTNRASQRMWGYGSESELLGKHVSEFWKDQDELDAALKQLTAVGSFSGSLTAIRKDGTTFDTLVSLNLVTDDKGHALGMVGSYIDITEQQKTHENIIEREARFRAITKSLFDAIILIDDRGDISFWNEAAERIFGYEESEVLGRNFHELFAPQEYHSDHFKAFQGFAASGQGNAVGKITELVAMRKTGEKFPVELSLSSFQMNGRWNAAGIVRDITERKKAEDDLKKSEDRFRQVAESADEWIWEVDKRGMYTYSSPVVEKILGFQADEVVGKKFFYDFFLPEEAETLKELSFSVLGQGNSFRGFINRNLKKTGDVVVIESSGVAILDEDGRNMGYRGVDKDITERFRAEEDHRRLFTAIESADGSVVITDKNGKIEYVNPAFERITGYASSEVVGKNPGILKSGNHDAVFYEKLWSTLGRGEVWSGVIVNRRKDGTPLHEEVTISPVLESSGDVINYVKVSRDVTKELEIKNQLIQSQKMEAIGTLAGGIAHDFNNILFAITGNTELVIQSVPQDSRICSNLQRVLDAANRAGDMVKQILAFSRQDKPERQPLDVSPIIKEGIKFLRASIPATIEIRQFVESRLPKIDGDPTQIHQVLINLCTNAAHAMKGTKGVLTINLKSVHLEEDFRGERLPKNSGDYIYLSVADTGQGMSPEIMDHIFEPYFTTKEKGEGTGFGLSIVHSIVQNHGGFVKVQSEPGRGATFSVYFPVIEGSGQKTTETPKTTSIVGGNEQILLVDDEMILVDVGQSIFESLGYRVVAVTDPVEALRIFKDNPDDFDLIFTDLAMPKMPGDELTKEVRSIRQDIPVIVCSGLTQSLTADRAKELGINAVLNKPLLKKDMAMIVRKALDSKDQNPDF